MKLGSLGRQVILVFVVTVIGYLVMFHFIERRRATKGPWAVTFIAESGTPAIIVNQTALGIQNVRIIFADEHSATNSTRTMEFTQARQWPYEVPFGKCVFMDVTFLPGTITFDLRGHEIQLMPRVLTIDKAERAWRSGETISLTNATAAHL